MRVEKLVPEVYYKESRDFSYIGRLFEIVFNYMKTQSDLVGQNLNSENSNSFLLDLFSYSLGFESKHDYINKDVINIISTFIDLIRNKGTKYAVEQAVAVLLNSQKIEANADIIWDSETYNISLYIPEALEDLILLEDLFEYILPTGWTYSIIRTTFLGDYNPIESIIQSDLPQNHKVNKSNIGQVVKVESGYPADVYNSDTRSDYYTGTIYTENN